MARSSVWRLMTFTIKDDRGRPTPLCNFTTADLRAARPTRTPHDAEILIFGRTVYPYVLTMMLVVVGGPLLLTTMGWFPSRYSPKWFHMLSLFPVLMPIIVPRLPRKWWGQGPDDARRSLVRVGICASCGYPLREVAPEPDGCTVCPECGAAWRLLAALKDATNAPTGSSPTDRVDAS